MKLHVVVDGTKIISYGYSDYIVKGNEEIIEISKNDYPYGARKEDVYWNGTKGKYKTQSMIDAEKDIEKEKEDKQALYDVISTKLVDVLNQMVDGAIPVDFLDLVNRLK